MDIEEDNSLFFQGRRGPDPPVISVYAWGMLGLCKL